MFFEGNNGQSSDTAVLCFDVVHHQHDLIIHGAVDVARHTGGGLEAIRY